MRHGPFLFVGLLFALALSWLGMVATPQLQLGNEQPTNVPPASVLYPTPHPGEANLGREVYRANGCAYCHTRVVRQDGTRLDVVVTDPGTNQTSFMEALVQMRPDLPVAEAKRLVAPGPVTVLSVATRSDAEKAQKVLTGAGAEASVRLVGKGPDIERGWGVRLTVARDYLYDSPLMLGSVRIGPDLTNIGLRRPDAIWHLVHLYDPRLQVAGSIMPRYPFLFEKRPRTGHPSADALPIPGDEEIIPTRQARALAAYLTSLGVSMPLFEAPAPALANAAGSAGGTNQPATTGTNLPAGTPGANAPAANQATPK